MAYYDNLDEEPPSLPITPTPNRAMSPTVAPALSPKRNGSEKQNDEGNSDE